MIKVQDTNETPIAPTQQPSSSFFGGLDVVDYGYKKTSAAGLAAYAARSVLEQVRDYTSIPSVSRCFPYYGSKTWPPLASQRLKSGQFIINKCGNKNACVVCSRAHDAESRKAFSEQFDDFIRQGYKPYWQTFDIGFKTTTSGKNRVKIMGSFWRKLGQNTKYRKLIGKARVLGFRVTEFEYDWESEDWTPHYHVVWLFNSELTESEIGGFMAHTSTFWRGQQNNHPECEPNNGPLYYNNLDSSSTKSLGHYLFKAFYLNVACGQLTLPDLLKTPSHFLVDFAIKGNLDSLDIWIKYERTSKNTRRLSFTGNWRRQADNMLRNRANNLIPNIFVAFPNHTESPNLELFNRRFPEVFKKTNHANGH